MPLEDFLEEFVGAHETNTIRNDYANISTTEAAATCDDGVNPDALLAAGDPVGQAVVTTCNLRI